MVDERTDNNAEDNRLKKEPKDKQRCITGE